MSALEMLGYPASLVMGLALGLTGGGGSILTVPILVYLFGIGALQATAYSLALVGLVAAWGAWGAYRRRDLQLGRALMFGVPGVAGVLVSRRVLLPGLPDSVWIAGTPLSQNSLLLVVFAILMLAVSVSMIRASRGAGAPPGTHPDARVSRASLGLAGLVTGLLAGFVGAGGGFLIVPALVKMGRLDMRQAVGTSLFVIALQSLLGVAGDFRALSQIEWPLFVSIAVLAGLGMSLGTKFRDRISQPRLKLGFGVFVLVMGAFILVQEFRKGSL